MVMPMLAFARLQSTPTITSASDGQATAQELLSSPRFQHVMSEVKRFADGKIDADDFMRSLGFQDDDDAAAYLEEQAGRLEEEAQKPENRSYSYTLYDDANKLREAASLLSKEGSRALAGDSRSLRQVGPGSSATIVSLSQLTPSSIASTPSAKPLDAATQARVVEAARQSTVRFGTPGSPSEGSGVIIGKQGNDYYVLTTVDVTAGAKTINLQLPDGSTATGTVVAAQQGHDDASGATGGLAVVKFTSLNSFTVAPLASQPPSANQSVVQLGAPESASNLSTVPRSAIGGLRAASGTFVQGANGSLGVNGSGTPFGMNGGGVFGVVGPSGGVRLMGISTVPTDASASSGRGVVAPMAGTTEIRTFLNQNNLSNLLENDPPNFLGAVNDPDAPTNGSGSLIADEPDELDPFTTAGANMSSDDDGTA